MANNRVLGLNYVSEGSCSYLSVHREHCYTVHPSPTPSSVWRLCRVTSALVREEKMGIMIWPNGWTTGFRDSSVSHV